MIEHLNHVEKELDLSMGTEKPLDLGRSARLTHYA